MIRVLSRALATIGALLAISLWLAAPGTTSPTGTAGEEDKGSGQLAVATFASGCFWCSQSDFDKVPGVVKTVVGFMGGHTKNPTYEQVSFTDTGHAEVVQVSYDPQKVSYEKLLDVYWHTTDVLDGRGQFCDRGSNYRPVIFTHDAEQKRLAETGKAALDASKRFPLPIAVKIEDASEFTAADEHHQEYYQKNPLRYMIYRHGCGRDARIRQLWGDEALTH